MNGILVIDKPAGMTSHDVVSRVRRILKTKRIGHTGTLDPFATGVMVLLAGRATRLAQFLDKDEKEYVAEVKLGFETETGDRTGEARAASYVRDPVHVDDDEIRQCLIKFVGESNQTPPMYSAKKIDGQKLYELARRGETVERKSVRVNISALEMLERSADNRFTMKAAVSAGTYIRTLAEDIGRQFECGAHLTELRRIRAGEYTIDESRTLEELAEMPEPSDALKPLSEALGHLPSIMLEEERVEKTKQGLSTRVFTEEFEFGDVVKMLDTEGELIAVGRYNDSEKAVEPKIVLI